MQAGDDLGVHPAAMEAARKAAKASVLEFSGFHLSDAGG